MPDIKVSTWGELASGLAVKLEDTLDGQSAAISAMALSLVLISVLEQSPTENRLPLVGEIQNKLSGFIAIMEMLGQQVDEQKRARKN